jgi:FGGY family of carbohydrate kinases, C-terminal domain
LILTGGMARNEVYAQMIADIINLEVISMSSGNVDMTLIGAAIAAWHANLQLSHLSLEQLHSVTFPFLEIKKYTPNSKYQR